MLESSIATHLDGVKALGEVRLLLLGLLQFLRRFFGAQPTANGARLLRPEVKRNVLLVLVEKAEMLALLEVDDGKHASNGLADVGADSAAMSVQSEQISSSNIGLINAHPV